MSNFKIGEKVVCIDPTEGLVKNEIYTIFEVYKGWNPENIIVDGLVLYEILSKNGDGFQASRFRKLDYEFAENLLKEISESVNQKHLQN